MRDERVSRAEWQNSQVRSAALQKSLEDLLATDTELNDVDDRVRAAKFRR